MENLQSRGAALATHRGSAIAFRFFQSPQFAKVEHEENDVHDHSKRAHEPEFVTGLAQIGHFGQRRLGGIQPRPELLANRLVQFVQSIRIVGQFDLIVYPNPLPTNAKESSNSLSISRYLTP